MDSNRNTYGLAFNGSYQYESFNVSSNVIKVLSSNENDLQQRLLQTNRGFDPIAANDFQANLSTSLSWSGNSLSFTNPGLRALAPQQSIHMG